MTKSQLAKELTQRHESLSVRKAEDIVDTLFDILHRTLAAGRRIEIRQFGVIEHRKYRAYAGRNPKTQEKVRVAPKTVPFWKTSRTLIAQMNLGMSSDKQ